jgi:hypothetical protein
MSKRFDVYREISAAIHAQFKRYTDLMEGVALDQDGWPEYYDGKNARLIGKQSRKYQAWTIGAFLIAKELIANPNHLELVLI